MAKNLVFPSQEMITFYVDKKAFDSAQFISPRLGLQIDATNFLDSPATVTWDVLEPNTGMTEISSLDAAPVNVGMRVVRTMREKPLFYRECIIIGEKELIEARKAGSSVERAGDDLVLSAVNRLNDRCDARVESSLCQALTGELYEGGEKIVDYGFSTAQKPDVKNTSGYTGKYWTDSTNSNPIADICKAAEQLRYKDTYGISLVLDVSVLSLMLGAAATIDLFKASPLSVNLAGEQIINAFPQLLRAGISEILVSTQGEAGQPFLSGKHAFLIGRSRSSALGAFASVPNVYSGLGRTTARAGKFMVIDDEFTRTQGAVPRVTVTGGIFGLPVLYRPDLVVAMKISA